jgi:RimJ/RimL family protein N-acetyltransferase
MEMVKAMQIHFDDYFLLRCDSNNVLWSGHKQEPDFDRLKDWYLKNIVREDRLFFLAYQNIKEGGILGYLYMDIIGIKKDVIDIGYGIHQTMNGKGYGTKLINFACNYTRNNIRNIKLIDAWVAENNIGSKKVFAKNGFSKTNETKLKIFEINAQEVLFEKYILKV